MTLTKAQREKAKMAVVADLNFTSYAPQVGFNDVTVEEGDPEYVETQRLISVAIAAVRKDRGAKR